MSEKNKQPRKNIGAILLEYMEKHPDVTIYRDSIASDLGLTPAQVQQNIYGLWYRNVAGAKDRIQTVVNGNAWIYRSATTKPAVPTQPKRVFEELAITKAGELLIQDEAGTVYLAKEL